jgi:hypothetical protein
VQVAEQRKAMGASDAANQRSMRALRAELKARTMKGTDGRWHGPLQPTTILNFNPVELEVGGAINMRIPSFNNPSSKTQWKFARGGRIHRAHYVTLSEAKCYLSPAGHEDHVELKWAAATLHPRYLTPGEIAWHFWRAYATPTGDGEYHGGVLIFDGDIHELEETRLKKSENKVLVPESYIIPDTEGQLGIRLREADLYKELDLMVQLQVNYCNETGQKAYELFNSKDPVERKNVTKPMREWGLFGVDIGYFKEKQPWMNENADASATAEAMKVCPVCRTSTIDPDAIMCGPCKAPYDQDCAVECVKRGYPLADSFLDTLDKSHHEQVVRLLREQGERRRARESATEGVGRPARGAAASRDKEEKKEEDEPK